MKSNEQIDEAFRIRLYDAEVPAPAHVWPAVEESLRKRKRRILFFWLWFGGLLALGGAYWLLRTADSPAGKYAVKVAPPLENAPNTTTVDATVGANSLQPAPSANIPAKQLPPTKRSAKSVRRAASFVPDNAPALPFAAPGVASMPPATVQHQDGMPQAISASDLNILSSSPAERNPLFALPAGKITGIAPALSPTLAVPNKIPRRNRLIRRNRESKYCFDFGKHPKAWMVDAYIGPSLAFKELSTTNPEYKDYVENRRSTETRLWAFNGGIRANYIFDRFLKLSAGLHYDQMVERFDYVDPNSLQITVKWEYVNGVLTPVDTLAVSYGDAYLVAYNRFGMLELPLQAGVELRKGRSGININAGLSFNLLFWKRGAILSPLNGEPSYFTPGDASGQEIFQTRTGMSAIGNFQWFYHLKPRTRLFVETYFRQIIQPINLGTHPVSQRYGIGGLRLGVSRILK